MGGAKPRTGLKHMKKLVLSLAALLIVSGSYAETFKAVVVGVSDGDTVKVLDSSKTEHKVRLMGIDAPEMSQPYGKRSKQSLSSLTYGSEVTIDWQKKDRYGRIVGKLFSPSGSDINLEQINRGMAWHYKDYQQEQSPEDRFKYAHAENAASANGLGLWSDLLQVPPWEYRKTKRSGSRWAD